MCMTQSSWTEQQLRDELNRYEEELRMAGKARNTVTTYVQHPERFINWLVGRYQARSVVNSGERAHADSQPVSKYEPFRAHLATREGPLVRMRFEEIEALLQRPLPASARRYRPWWANEQSGTHVHARSWLDSGWTTRNVDLHGETVEFIR